MQALRSSQTTVVSIVSVYERILVALMFGMNIEKINWKMAQREIEAEDQDDPVILGFKALLLHPSVFPSTLLQKNEVEFHTVWSEAEKVGLTEEADSGNVFAQWLRGMYADIFEHNYDKAKRYHTLAANQGFALSQNSLGKLYEKLGDVEISDDEYQGDQNYDTAIEYYELSANQGHADAQYNLAIMYEPDFEQMKPYLEQAANQQHPEALFYLGNPCMESDVVELDFEMAKKCFERAAMWGHAKALEKLVFLFIEYRKKLHLEETFWCCWYEIRRKVYEQAAEQGHADAQYNLGLLYYFQDNGEVDYIKARYYFEQAANQAEQGDADAQCNLGVLYGFGDGVEQGIEQDYGKAQHYYELAASQGDANSQCKLGHLYYECKGVEQDYNKARHYYELAANQGKASAQNNLGNIYREGLGVEQDYNKARYFYELAAEQVNTHAQSKNLGDLYLTQLKTITKQFYCGQMSRDGKSTEQELD